jgi:hypothetical protein
MRHTDKFKHDGKTLKLHYQARTEVIAVRVSKEHKHIILIDSMIECMSMSEYVNNILLQVFDKRIEGNS